MNQNTEIFKKSSWDLFGVDLSEKNCNYICNSTAVTEYERDIGGGFW